ncbi:TerB family tellurite resistance protein [Flavisolibacter nicotianae]|uniref:TerB family tellurite resistance protein n=1 Tax=Flavisolibacter nicotianae TaxID=2364882 RepID=UPI000EB30DAA|nr:TerB family tellurite resistance protein [Flavisolibacter nicotianae]
MKRMIFVLLLLLTGATVKVSAQQAEIEQLLLNVEKLAQLRQILADLKKGYEIVTTSYNTVKEISEGSFDLHKTFLDGLLEVSPAVRNYKRVADIINGQLLIVKEYKNAYRRFRQDANFTPEEIKYLGSVYANLFRQSLKNLETLAVLLTDGDLRMSDDERLRAIDDVFRSMEDKLLFLRHFNNNTTILAVQRAREKKDVATAQKIYGIAQ